jgi:hypothetical protein
MKNKKRDGYGKYMMFDESSYYEGMFSNDKPNGFGVYVKDSSDCYVGMWLDGKAHGQGRFESSDGVSMIPFLEYLLIVIRSPMLENGKMTSKMEKV